MGIPTLTSHDLGADSRPASLGGYVDRPRLPISPNSPFFLVHHAASGGSWEVATEGMPGPTWLPVLQPYPIRPGAAGVRTVTAGEPRSRMWSRAVQILEEGGAVVLPLDLHVSSEHLPEGAAPGPYLRETDCLGGTFYHTAWEKPRRGVRGNTVQHHVDRAALNRWRASLVTSGVIAPPDPAILADAKARAARRVNVAARDASIPSEARAEAVATAKARADALDKATPPSKPAKAPKAPAQ